MNEKFTKLYELAKDDLIHNLLPWWVKYDVDHENGGFYGEVYADNTPVPNANKFITLNARLLWTFSSAYRVLGDAQYKDLADRAYHYLIDHFLDREYGGYFTTVDIKGNVVDAHKYIYGNAFVLYGLSEYVRAVGNQEALGHARDLVDKLEEKVWDSKYKGYYESAHRDWRIDPWTMGVNRNPEDIKTMNTHLHLIEAYTCHLRVRDDNFMRNKVREHLYVMLNKIVNHDIHHYHYFQDRAWNPNSSDISYGHDIEGSWLMLETAEVLGEPEAYRYTRDTCVNIARACYEEGLTPEGAMLGEYDPVTGHRSQYLGWWEQNETVVGMLNAWELTGDEKFLDASLKNLEYTLAHFVDHEKGGWFPTITLEGKRAQRPNRPSLKVMGPLCPYHNGRMAMEIIERYERHQKKG